jgi:hypothetical protein
MQAILVICSFTICCFISVHEEGTISVGFVTMVEAVTLEETRVELLSQSPVFSEPSNIDTQLPSNTYCQQFLHFTCNIRSDFYGMQPACMRESPVLLRTQ